MTAYSCYYKKDTMLLKGAKRSLLLRMAALLLALILSVYVWMFCLGQMKSYTKIDVEVFQLDEKRSLDKESNDKRPPENESSENLTPDNGSTEKLPPANDSNEQLPPDNDSTEKLPPANDSNEQLPPANDSNEKLPPVNESNEKQSPDNVSKEKLSRDNQSILLQNLDVHYPHPKTFSRAECAHNPVRYFAIISMQRSGSGWFETLLNSHVNVSSNGEIFYSTGRRRNTHAIVRTLDKLYNLDWLTSASKNECSAAVGFKWMLNQGLMEHHKEVSEYFIQKGVSLIFLFRRNILRRMVSLLANSYDRHAKMLNGIHRAHVHTVEEAKTLAEYKPYIKTASLISDIQLVETTISRALESFHDTRHIVLYYEDVVKNITKLRDVQEFLRLPLMQLKSQHVKIHNGSLSEHISNWLDVRKILHGTPYEGFLESD